jgi:hypothetical protein
VKSNRRIDALYDLKNDPLEQNNLLKRASSAPAITAAMKKFKAIVAAMPKNDARPQYRLRKANPWDREPQAAKKKFKKNRGKKKRKNQRSPSE